MASCEGPSYLYSVFVFPFQLVHRTLAGMLGSFAAIAVMSAFGMVSYRILKNTMQIFIQNLANITKKCHNR